MAHPRPKTYSPAGLCRWVLKGAGLAACIMLLLTGCTGDPAGGADLSGDAPADQEAEVPHNATQEPADLPPEPAPLPPAPAPAITADTFYIVDEEVWSVAVPNGTQPYQVPLRAGDQGMLWKHIFRADATLAGGALELWYRVTGPVAHTGVEPSPFTCTFSLSFFYEPADGGSIIYGEGCYWAPPGLLAEGDHRLMFPLDGHARNPIEVRAGDYMHAQLSFHVVTAGTEPALHVLAGTPDATRFQMLGMQEPLAGPS